MVELSYCLIRYLYLIIHLVQYFSIKETKIMSYEMFEQGPSVYVPILILSLLITVIAYCAFPLIFAIVRKSPIEERKYSRYCYITNAIIAVIFLVLNGGAANFAPYILWTSIFVSVGKKILSKKDAISD